MKSPGPAKSTDGRISRFCIILKTVIVIIIVQQPPLLSYPDRGSNLDTAIWQLLAVILVVLVVGRVRSEIRLLQYNL